MRASLLLAAVASIAIQQSVQPPVQAPAPLPARPPASRSAQPPLFRTTTRLVQINVVVHDRHGQPLTDLAKEDFAIVDKGKPQAISFFSMDSASAVTAPPAAPMPLDVFTNFPEARGGVPTGVTVILLDLANTAWTDQHYAKDALLKFLKQIQPQDRIAIFTLGAHGLTLLHDYTTDAASLVDRLNGEKGELPQILDASTLDDSTQQELRGFGLDSLADGNVLEADFYMTSRILNTLAAFQVIAQHLAGLPGRKSLVWLSGGIPMMIGFDDLPAAGAPFSPRDQRIFTPEMDAAVRALNNSGIAVYPVDARGLMPPPGFSASARTPPKTLPSLAKTNANTDTMLELASRTGGRAAYNTNDLAGAIRRAVDDGRVTYTLGYYPTDAAEDGKFHEVKVTVHRSGIDVRYRKGYFAMRPASQTADMRKRDMRAAVWSPLDSTEIPVAARVDFIDTAQKTINSFIQVDPTSVSFKKDGDRWKAVLDVAYVQKDDRGRDKGPGEVDTISLALTEENYRKLSQQGMIHQHRSLRAAGATTLRIVVRDADTGAVGSVTVPIDKLGPAK